MTDTGQVPGEGQPGNAGMVEQPGLPAPGAYTFLDPSETPPEDDDLLLMPGAQGAWSEPQGQPQFQPRAADAAGPLPEPGAHETGGRDSGSVEVGAVRAQSPPPPRRPLHMGPPLPDTTGGVVRSLADRGPTAAPAQPVPVSTAGPQTLGPEYLDFPRDEAEVLPGPQLGEIPPHAAPWSPQPVQAAPEPVPPAAHPGQSEQAPLPDEAPAAPAVAAETVAPEPVAPEPVAPEPVAVQAPAVPAPAVPDTAAEPAQSVAGQHSMGRFVPVEGSLPSAPHLAPTPVAAMTAPETAEPDQPEAEAAQSAARPAEELPADLAAAEPAVPAPAAETPAVTPHTADGTAAQAGVPVADAVPAAAPEPVADAVAEAVPQPVPQARPEPVAAAEAEAAGADGAEREAVGTGTGGPESTPAPVHVPESVPIEAGEQQSEAVASVPAPRHGGAPGQQLPAVEPLPHSGAQAEPEAQAAPWTDAAVPPAADPAVPPAADPVAPPAAEPAGAAAAEPMAEPMAEPAAEPAAAATADAPAATTADAMPDVQPEPAATERTEPVPAAAAGPVQPPEAQPFPVSPEQPAEAQPGPEQSDVPQQGEPEPGVQPHTGQDAFLAAEAQPAEAEPLTAAAPGYDDAEREAVLRVMRERRDIRNGFRSDPIPHEVLLRVLEAAHTAPSVGHSQPWDFVVIRSAETRRSMHELAQRQREAYAKSLPKGRAKQFKELKIEAILDTPVNIVVTADPTRGGRHTLGRHTQPQMAPYSSALAVENLWLAARAEGLGVGWVSYFDEREMVRALGLPEHLEVVAYLCVGYVDEFPEEPELMQAGWSKRRPLSWVVHEETYGRRALPGEEPHDLLQETITNIRPLDAKALGEAWDRQKRMTKPAGALGMLEIISAQLSGLSRMCPPPIPEPAAVAIFAGDHGVYAQGVTAWPQEVTCQMVANFLGGGAVCNAFANQVGAEVCVVDVGVAGELPATPGLLPRKVRAGTADFTTGPALTREEVLAAIEVGIETARDLVAAGNKVLLTGEMGIANTTVSAALICVYTGQDAGEVTGRGTGINDEMHARKVDVVRRGLDLHQPDPADPIGVLAAVGGLEHAALAGFLLGGASLRTPVILDGVSAGAAALVARAIAPEALAACIAGHRSAEPGHVAALNKLGLRPLVDLDLRLGEGTGALLALPVVQSAARAMHEVATFDSAGVTEK
ncbi:nicotinate-nucleotide--dimethylbenzimidazole phosphoribosyltransferase [Streptomyces sp. NBC_00859]|uniref:nicotinate-nucleotide--dimethylbenzimidazole phosphoribosyltransferase n=1 Tax=Streptomyces sp. NBC_00859 TaxID=2903682 RepID=UPI00386E7723|nr:nicotinate-nucleotide--dimethylbenzimidazole phosphoribosyltransferase [Streptomyces sp. NBC_00859]